MGALSGARVLVTGATGFIGTHLVSRLRTERLSRLVLLSRHADEKASRAGEVAVASDLADLRWATWREASVDAFDIVFHLGAATVRSRTGGQSQAEVVRTNVVGTQALLESLPGAQTRVVFASAVDVFAPSNDVIDESSPVGNRGLYAASKLMGEALVTDWAYRSGSAAVIARVGHVYGPGEDAYGKAIPTFIQAALDDHPLIVYGDGSTVRDLLYVTDAVEALIRTATAPMVEKTTVMILAGDGSTTIAELAHRIAEIAGKPGLVTLAGDRDAGFSTRFSTQKMKCLLGDWERVPLSVGLREEVAYFNGRSGGT